MRKMIAGLAAATLISTFAGAAMAADTLTFNTTEGPFTIELFEDLAPQKIAEPHLGDTLGYFGGQ